MKLNNTVAGSGKYSAATRSTGADGSIASGQLTRELPDTGLHFGRAPRAERARGRAS
jgi:hypothetical protein